MTDQFDPLEAEEARHLASPIALGAYTISDFVSAKHQKIIADAYMDALMGIGPKNIIVEIQQQSGKSEISSFLIPAHFLESFCYGWIPGGYCGIISNEDSLSLYFSNRIRRLIEHNQDTFAAKLCPDTRAASFWEIEREDGKRGGVFAVGITGSIVGRPLSLMIIDDSTKTADQANSEKHRDQVWNFWTTVGIGRRQPWTIVMVVCVRWGPEDLIGRLKSTDYPGDPSEWRVIRIPTVADEENDPLGREIGQALIRPQILQIAHDMDEAQELANAEAENLQRSMSPYYWNTLCQQNPRDPDGTIFLERCWRYYGRNPTDENGQYPLPAPEDFDEVIMSWDMTFKDKKDSDWVVGQAWGAKGADRYLLDSVKGRWGFTETKGRVRSFAERVRFRYPKANLILVEDKANGPGIIDELRGTVGGLVEFPVSDYGSKQSRAHAVEPLQRGGNLYVPTESEATFDLKDFINETASFKGTGDEKDDQVDCMTQALLHMQKHKFHVTGVITGKGVALPDRMLGRMSRR